MSSVEAISKKRSTLKKQLTSLENALVGATLDRTNATLRLSRVKDLFFAYEELNDELELLDPENEGLSQMEDIRNRYYDLATRISKLPGGSLPDPTFGGGSGANSTFFEKQRLLKLPTAELPKFGGQYDKWTTFKNAFETMINARTDINDLVKFFYLRSALEGEALNKVSIFDATAENYKSAWELLVNAYDRKRILVSKHLDALIDTKPLQNVNAQALSKLVDDTRQHLNILKTLKVELDDTIVVRLLERALPISVRQKWEESLTLDTLPKLDEFYKFINATVFRLSTMELETKRVETEKGGKRSGESEAQSAKKAKNSGAARALVTSTAANGGVKCSHCGEAHRIYSCASYGGLSVDERWKAVQAKKLCKNCLGNHPGTCKAGTCKKCNEQHHTSLHRETKTDDKKA